MNSSSSTDSDIDELLRSWKDPGSYNLKKHIEKYVKEGCFAPFVNLNRPADYCCEFIKYIAFGICNDFVKHGSWGRTEKELKHPLKECPGTIANDLEAARLDVLYGNFEWEFAEWMAVLSKMDEDIKATNLKKLREHSFEKGLRMTEQLTKTRALFKIAKNSSVLLSDPELADIEELAKSLGKCHPELKKIKLVGETPKETEVAPSAFAMLETVLEDACDGFRILKQEIELAKQEVELLETSPPSGKRSAKLFNWCQDAIHQIDGLVRKWNKQFTRKEDRAYLSSVEYFLTAVKIQFEVLHSLDEYNQLEETREKVFWKEQMLKRLHNYGENAMEAETHLIGLETILKNAYVALQLGQLVDTDLPSISITHAR